MQTGPIRIWFTFINDGSITVSYNGANWVFDPAAYYLYYGPIFNLLNE